MNPEHTMNAAPTTSAAALINSAIELGLTICECAIGDGFIIVAGPTDAVVAWINEAPASVTMENNAGRSIAARVVRA